MLTEIHWLKAGQALSSFYPAKRKEVVSIHLTIQEIHLIAKVFDNRQVLAQKQFWLSVTAKRLSFCQCSLLCPQNFLVLKIAKNSCYCLLLGARCLSFIPLQIMFQL